MIFSWLFPPSPPLDEETQHWLDVRAAWIIKEFGLDRLRGKPTILSDDPRLLHDWKGTVEEGEKLFTIVCEIMDIRPEQVQLQWFSDGYDDSANWFPNFLGTVSVGLRSLCDGNDSPYQGVGRKPDGIFEKQDEKNIAWVNSSNLADPKQLLGTMANVLAHYHLLGIGRISVDMPDHELITDLLPIFFGLGVFMADRTVRSSCISGVVTTWSSFSRKGNLSARHYGYALALWSAIREEDDLEFASHLRPDARITFHQTLKYLKRTGFDSYDFIHFMNPNEQLDIPESIRLPEPLVRDDEEAEESGTEAAAQSTCHKASCGSQSSCHKSPPDGQPELTVDNKHAPDDADLIIEDHFTVGTIAMQQGEWEHAIGYFTAAIEEDPDDAEALEHRSTSYLAAGNAADAFRDADRAVQLDPSEITHQARGRAAMALEHFDQAYDDFNEALGYLSRWDADNEILGRLYFWRGMASFRMEENDDALADLTRAIRRDQGRPELYQARAEIYEKLGDLERAAEDRELAESFTPKESPE